MHAVSEKTRNWFRSRHDYDYYVVVGIVEEHGRLYLICVSINNFKTLCSFRRKSPSQLADVISLDYIVDEQLLRELDEGETVSLSFSQNNKTTKGQVSVQKYKLFFIG
jgi:hypothetical protein